MNSSFIEKVLFLPYYTYVFALQDSDTRRLMEIVRSEPYRELVNETATALGRKLDGKDHYVLCRRRVFLWLCKYLRTEGLADTRRLAVALAMVTIDLGELELAQAVRPKSELKSAFVEVWFKTGTLRWHYCFAEGVERTRFSIRLMNPFRMCSVHSPGHGYISCRESIVGIGELPRETHGYGPVAGAALWMYLRREDVLWAIDVCQRFSEDA